MCFLPECFSNDTLIVHRNKKNIQKRQSIEKAKKGNFRFVLRRVHSKTHTTSQVTDSEYSRKEFKRKAPLPAGVSPCSASIMPSPSRRTSSCPPTQEKTGLKSSGKCPQLDNGTVIVGVQGVKEKCEVIEKKINEKKIEKAKEQTDEKKIEKTKEDEKTAAEQTKHKNKPSEEAPRTSEEVQRSDEKKHDPCEEAERVDPKLDPELDPESSTESVSQTILTILNRIQISPSSTEDEEEVVHCTVSDLLDCIESDLPNAKENMKFMAKKIVDRVDLLLCQYRALITDDMLDPDFGSFTIMDKNFAERPAINMYVEICAHFAGFENSLLLFQKPLFDAIVRKLKQHLAESDPSGPVSSHVVPENDSSDTSYGSSQDAWRCLHSACITPSEGILQARGLLQFFVRLPWNREVFGLSMAAQGEEKALVSPFQYLLTVSNALLEAPSINIDTRVAFCCGFIFEFMENEFMEKTMHHEKEFFGDCDAERIDTERIYAERILAFDRIMKPLFGRFAAMVLFGRFDTKPGGKQENPETLSNRTRLLLRSLMVARKQIIDSVGNPGEKYPGGGENNHENLTIQEAESQYKRPEWDKVAGGKCKIVYVSEEWKAREKERAGKLMIARTRRIEKNRNKHLREKVNKKAKKAFETANFYATLAGKTLAGNGNGNAVIKNDGMMKNSAGTNKRDTGVSIADGNANFEKKHEDVKMIRAPVTEKSVNNGNTIAGTAAVWNLENLSTDALRMELMRRSAANSQETSLQETSCASSEHFSLKRVPISFIKREEKRRMKIRDMMEQGNNDEAAAIINKAPLIPAHVTTDALRCERKRRDKIESAIFLSKLKKLQQEDASVGDNCASGNRIVVQDTAVIDGKLPVGDVHDEKTEAEVSLTSATASKHSTSTILKEDSCSSKHSISTENLEKTSYSSKEIFEVSCSSKKISEVSFSSSKQIPSKEDSKDSAFLQEKNVVFGQGTDAYDNYWVGMEY